MGSCRTCNGCNIGWGILQAYKKNKTITSLFSLPSSSLLHYPKNTFNHISLTTFSKIRLIRWLLHTMLAYFFFEFLCHFFTLSKQSQLYKPFLATSIFSNFPKFIYKTQFQLATRGIRLRGKVVIKKKWITMRHKVVNYRLL